MKLLFNSIAIIVVYVSLSWVMPGGEDDDVNCAAYEPKITGTWAEIWGKEGWDSNVDYIDTVVVDIDNQGNFFMFCTNKPHYDYDKISFDGKNFNFRMENSNGDEADRFYVNYWMHFSESEDKLVGESKNSREDHNYVRMLRIE